MIWLARKQRLCLLLQFLDFVDLLVEYGVMILMLNRPEFVEATLAANQLGADRRPGQLPSRAPGTGFPGRGLWAEVMVTERFAPAAQGSGN